MNALIAFSLRQRVLILALFIMTFFGGIVAFRQLNIEAYPDPTPPMVDIITQSPGLSAEELERYVTIPIENQVAALKLAVGRNPNTDPDGSGPLVAPLVSAWRRAASTEACGGTVRSPSATTRCSCGCKRGKSASRGCKSQAVIMASTAAAAVSTMGRKRRTAAPMMASQAGTPRARSCSIWSIKITELR